MCRDDDGKIHAFHNVCRHHASLVASGNGQKSCFVCPYHVSSLLNFFGFDHKTNTSVLAHLQNSNFQCILE